jgi:DNA-binding IclR family transcriptional regulator
VSRIDGRRDDLSSQHPYKDGTSLTGLSGPRDYWDRPDGNWGLLVGPDAVNRRQHANSCYRLGTRALRRGDLHRAVNWLAQARSEKHPGATLRLALALWHLAMATHNETHAGPKVIDMVMDAARFGHGDAFSILLQAGWPEAQVAAPVETAAGEWEDPEFAPPLSEAIAAIRPSLPRPRQEREQPQRPAAEARPVRTRRGTFSPRPLRAAATTALAQQAPTTAGGIQWESALRVLDVLDVIGSSLQPVSTHEIFAATSIPHRVLKMLLLWLCQQGFARRLPDGGFTPGPVLLELRQPNERSRPERILQTAMTRLRDAAGAAVYLSTYASGEISIAQCADGPGTPKVNEWVDFRSAAHASAVGKSLLQQLDFERRMDHLARHRAVRLTSRTITDPARLFRAIDNHGPQAPQFDLLEYSPNEVCVAVSLGIGGQAGCVALSLPISQRHRLLDAARVLTEGSTGLLLSLLLASQPTSYPHTGPTQSAHGSQSSARHHDLSLAQMPTLNNPPGLWLPTSALRTHKLRQQLDARGISHVERVDSDGSPTPLTDPAPSGYLITDLPLIEASDLRTRHLVSSSR